MRILPTALTLCAVLWAAPSLAAQPVTVTDKAGLNQLQCNTDGTCSVRVVNPVAAVYSAQQVMTASSVCATAHAMLNGIIVKALPANTGTVYVGPSGVTTSTGFPLAAGEPVAYAVPNASAVCLLSTVAGDVVALTGN